MFKKVRSLVKEEANIFFEQGLIVKKVLNKKRKMGSTRWLNFPKKLSLTDGWEEPKLFENVLQTDEAVHPPYRTKKARGWGGYPHPLLHNKSNPQVLHNFPYYTHIVENCCENPFIVKQFIAVGINSPIQGGLDQPAASLSSLPPFLQTQLTLIEQHTLCDAMFQKQFLQSIFISLLPE